MTFKLRSQSPLTQTNYVYDPNGLGDSPLNQKKSFSQLSNSNKQFYNKAQKSLAKSNANIKKLDPTGEKRKAIYSDTESIGSWMDRHPIVKSAVQILDPTGVSSYDDVKKAWGDNKFDSADILEPIGAIPVIGKAEKVLYKGFKLAKNTAKNAVDIYKASKVANRVGNANSAYDGISGSVNTPARQEKSPLQKQKLSPKAAKAKAARDLAYAKTDDRRKKKAHAQRMHRKDPSGKGKDWDHEDGRWESVKQNRGNEGEGTKKESGKRYKVK
jgi:hypothetical protein